MITGILATAASKAETRKAVELPYQVLRQGLDFKGFIVSGAQHISEKMLALVAECIKASDEYGAVRSVTFINEPLVAKDGDNCTGMCYPQTGAMTISLVEIFEQLMEQISAGTCNLSITAAWMANVLQCAMHEMHHLIAAGADPNAYAARPLAELEDEADEASMRVLKWAAKRFDMEPCALKDETFLSLQMAAVFMKHGDNKNIIRQRHMLEDGVAYRTEGGHEVRTLREFLRARFDEKAVDLDWTQPTFPIKITFNPSEKGVVHTFTPEAPVAQPVLPQAPAGFTVVGDVGEAGSRIIVDSSVQEMLATDDEGNTIDTSVFDDEEVVMPTAAVMQQAVMVQAPVAQVPGAVVVNAPTDRAVLPAHVQAVATAATATPGVPTWKQPKTFAPNGHAVESIKPFLHHVWMRMYAHIFNKCGFDGRGGFANPAAVLEPVRIDDLVMATGMTNVLMEYDTNDAAGKWSPGVKVDGFIRGQVFRKSGLPGYVVYINVGGMCLKRVFVPQNGTTNSKSAEEARQGHVIAWVIDGDREDNDKSKWKIEIKDNNLRELA
jgi:hypothetical protein